MMYSIPSVLNSVTYSTCQLPFYPGLDCELQTVRKKTIISRINRKYLLDYHLCTLLVSHSSSIVTPSELGNNKSTSYSMRKKNLRGCPSFFLERLLRRSSCLSDDVSWSRENNPCINFTSFYALIELLYRNWEKKKHRLTTGFFFLCICSNDYDMLQL